MRRGYYRDHVRDVWLYLSPDDHLYYVRGPNTPAPSWRKICPVLDDTEAATPGAEDLALFERTRVASGIAE